MSTRTIEDLIVAVAALMVVCAAGIVVCAVMIRRNVREMLRRQKGD